MGGVGYHHPWLSNRITTQGCAELGPTTLGLQTLIPTQGCAELGTITLGFQMVIITQGWAELGPATLGFLGSICGTHTAKKESQIQGHQERLEFKVIACIVKTLTPLFVCHWEVQVFKQFAFS